MDPNQIYIFFDLETTGPTTWSQIISIGAIAVKSPYGDEIPGGRFECYIVPTNAIKPEASRVNGFTKEGGSLYKNGTRVDGAVHPKEGLKHFVDYLSRLARASRVDDDGETKKINFVAHNAHKFDGIILINTFSRFGIDYGNTIG